VGWLRSFVARVELKTHFSFSQQESTRVCVCVCVVLKPTKNRLGRKVSNRDFVMEILFFQKKIREKAIALPPPFSLLLPSLGLLQCVCVRIQLTTLEEDEDESTNLISLLFTKKEKKKEKYCHT